MTPRAGCYYQRRLYGGGEPPTESLKGVELEAEGMSYKSGVRNRTENTARQSSRAAMVRHRGAEGLNSRNLFSHNLGSWKSKIKGSAELIFSKVSLLHLLLSVSLCKFSLPIRTPVKSY